MSRFLKMLTLIVLVGVFALSLPAEGARRDAVLGKATVTAPSTDVANAPRAVSQPVLTQVVAVVKLQLRFLFGISTPVTTAPTGPTVEGDNDGGPVKSSTDPNKNWWMLIFRDSGELPAI